MARAFTDEEKAVIHERLLEVGKELFIRYGLKKTSIEDITKPVGIAKSSFYLFFNSKETLYLALMLREAPPLEEKLLNGSFRSTDDMREAIKRFLRLIVNEIETNELLKRLTIDPEELAMLEKYIPPELLERRANGTVPEILPYIRQGQEAGQIIEGKPEIIASVIRAVTTLTMQKRIFGSAYPEVMELLIDVVADGLTRPKNDTERETL